MSSEQIDFNEIVDINVNVTVWTGTLKSFRFKLGIIIPLIIHFSLEKFKYQTRPALIVI